MARGGGLLTCAIQGLRVGSGSNSQSVEQFPERTRVAPQLRSASLTSNPLYVIREKYPRNLGGEGYGEKERRRHTELLKLTKAGDRPVLTAWWLHRERLSETFTNYECG